MMPNAAELAEKIAGDFYGNRLDLSERVIDVPDGLWWQVPEVKYVRKLYESGTSGRDVRLFVTFLSAMDRARDSELVWSAGFDLFQSHPELFDPISVSAMSEDSLFNRLTDGQVSQRHSVDVNAWRTIARSLVSDRRCSVQKVIEDGVGNAEDLLRDLSSIDRAGRPRFPLLKGRKIGLMWIRILANPGQANICRINIIPVAVDVHVCRVTENLRVAGRSELDPERDRKTIQRVWRHAVENSEIGGPTGIENTGAALDPALWFFGKHGCSHCKKSGRRVPISSACRGCRFQEPAIAQKISNLPKNQRVRYEHSTKRSTKQAYWAELQQVIDSIGGPYSNRPRKPQEANWMSYSVGHGDVVLYIFISRRKHGRNDNISVELTTTNKDVYRNLAGQRMTIEKELGYELEWQERPNSKESRICVSLASADAGKPQDWKRQHQWFAERMNEFHSVFSRRVKVLSHQPRAQTRQRRFF